MQKSKTFDTIPRLKSFSKVLRKLPVKLELEDILRTMGH
jgi:hypothetical protein